jgi:hypothetical protein
MNIVNDLNKVTLLDGEAREATRPARDTLRHWTNHERRTDATLRATHRTFLQTSAFFRIGTAPVSPKLRDAILGLHRDDALRRAYVRRWWMEIGEPRKPASRTSSPAGGSARSIAV